MDQFNLEVITLAFSTQTAHVNAFDALTAEMINWKEGESFPPPKDVQAAIKAGSPHLSGATLKSYASGVLAWCKAGKTPKTIRQLTLERPEGHKAGRGGRPSKAKAMDSATITKPTEAANESQAGRVLQGSHETPRMAALTSLNNIQAIRTTLGVPMGTDFQAFEDHLCALIAILRAVKP